MVDLIQAKAVLEVEVAALREQRERFKEHIFRLEADLGLMRAQAAVDSPAPARPQDPPDEDAVRDRTAPRCPICGRLLTEPPSEECLALARGQR